MRLRLLQRQAGFDGPAWVPEVKSDYLVHGKILVVGCGLFHRRALGELGADIAVARQAIHKIDKRNARISRVVSSDAAARKVGMNTPEFGAKLFL